jgi:hypothetical protein
MTSKSARRRKAKLVKSRTAAVITLAGGETVDQKPDGRDRRHTNQPKENPMQTVINARIRRTGIMNPEEVMQPICGDDIGLCIRDMATGDDRALLVNTWGAISAAHRNYRMLIIGKTGTPQGASIPMIPEPLETDQSLRVDLRDFKTRVEDARGAWEAWEGKLATLPAPNLRWALRGALSGFLGDGALWRGHKPTSTGKAAVEALRILAEK